MIIQTLVVQESLRTQLQYIDQEIVTLKQDLQELSQPNMWKNEALVKEVTQLDTEGKNLKKVVNVHQRNLESLDSTIRQIRAGISRSRIGQLTYVVENIHNDDIYSHPAATTFAQWFSGCVQDNVTTVFDASLLEKFLQRRKHETRLLQEATVALEEFETWILEIYDQLRKEKKSSVTTIKKDLQAAGQIRLDLISQLNQEKSSSTNVNESQIVRKNPKCSFTARFNGRDQNLPKDPKTFCKILGPILKQAKIRDLEARDVYWKLAKLERYPSCSIPLDIGNYKIFFFENEDEKHLIFNIH